MARFVYTELRGADLNPLLSGNHALSAVGGRVASTTTKCSLTGVCPEAQTGAVPSWVQ